ncbi:MAG TPA: TIGR00730 family Rossman fold protein [Jatrophihabitans sp.]|nr:TIGR00730 family Rossman fold protein [Jatrophihabitans sp.]
MATFRVCVFCGASAGRSGEYVSIGRALGAELGRQGMGLVYGAGGVGMMGAVADGALAAGAEVIGVIPQALLDRENGRSDLTELRVVRTMHERKALMHELADAFVVLPGGLGTLDEMFETVTWSQLGLQHKPLVVLNVGGYYTPLAAWLTHAVAEGFLSLADQSLVRLVDSIDELWPVLRGLPAEA